MTKRKIKFRVWHKKEKKIYVVSRIEFLALSSNVGCVGRFIDADFEDVELMQYTGLKDKNGKEIWEGDLLGYESKLAKDKDKVTKWQLHIYEVLMEDGCWVGKAGAGTDLLCDLLKVDHLAEIIGNIWENPDWKNNDKE